MFCSHCGGEITNSSNYCSSCGARQLQKVSYKQLMLSATDSKIAGVCGGIAEYLDVDPTVVRLIWLVLSIVPGGIVGGLVAYLVAWIIIPKARVFASPAAAGAAPVQPPAKAV
jgi:phage shock protein C